MQNKSLEIIIAVVLVLGIGGLVYHKKQVSITPPSPGVNHDLNPDSTSTPTPTSTTTSPSGFTMAAVAQHNSRMSCWSAINGFVYDLTSWIPNHPGGEQRIIQLCGTDGSAKFNGQHGSDSRAKGILAGFKISTLTK